MSWVQHSLTTQTAYKLMMMEMSCSGEIEANEGPDPNKLFSSPYRNCLSECSNDYSVEDSGELSGQNENYITVSKTTSFNSSMKSPLRGMCNYLQYGRKRINNFWIKHSEKFASTWKIMTTTTRENFLRQVYPFMMQSLCDRYCWIDFKKQYRHDYDEILVLSPHLNIVDLVYEDHLITLIEKFSKDDALAEESAELVLRFRSLYNKNLLPLSSSDTKIYTRQIRIRRGDVMFMSDPSTNEFGECVVVENPLHILQPEGGQAHELYKRGFLMSHLEFKKVTENLAFMISLYNEVIFTITTQVLNKDASYMRNMASMSLNNNFSDAEFERDIMIAETYNTKGMETPVQSLIRSHLGKLSASSSKSQR